MYVFAYVTAQHRTLTTPWQGRIVSKLKNIFVLLSNDLINASVLIMALINEVSFIFTSIFELSTFLTP